MLMSLAQIFIHLFDDPEAQRQVQAYHQHTRLRPFNLATTSLRHIQKWYDRLSDIDHGVHREHGNFYSDPQSLGLVTRTGPTSVVLTAAGREFLDTAQLYYNDPPRAEYALNKILYHGGYSLGDADTFLNSKLHNLNEFLRKCRPTPNARTILDDSRLLAIAEVLSSFGSALEAFLLLRRIDLLAFAELGERGFNSLLQGAHLSPGYINLARRIAGDYTRASVRRRNYLLSQLFLTLRHHLISSGSQFLPLVIPYPYANMVTERAACETVNHFTDDITIEPEIGGYIVFLRETVTVQPLPSPPSIQAIRLAERRSRTYTPRTLSTITTRPRTPESYYVEAPLTVEAENHVERILRVDHGEAVWRIGHTQAETAPLSDGLLPGADIIIRNDEGKAVRFVEVKSARGDLPSSFRLTATEYARALKCNTDNVPYDLYVVSFLEGQSVPIVSLLPGFQNDIAGLTINDVLSMEIRIAQA